MWGFYTRWIGKAFDKKIDATGLGVFRIAYSIVMLCEVIQLHYFRHLIFDKIPYVAPGEVDFGYGLICWGIAVVFMIFGWYTRYASILNYLFTLTFLGTIGTYEYHMFYAYLGTNAILMFIPLDRALSIDNLRRKLRDSTIQRDAPALRTVTALAFTIPVFVAVAFVYADSMLHKLTSYNWMNGLGMWLPANLPMVTHADTTFIMNQQWLALGAGYLTLVFEAVFIFVMWFKRFRIICWLIGTALHLGIVIEFPIPWFGLGVTAVYLLMVPTNWWARRRIQFKEPTLRFLYDAECPLCLRTRLTIQHFDCFGGVTFQSIQSQQGTESLLESFTEEELLSEVYGIGADGTIYKGLDTYIQAFNSMVYTAPLAWFLQMPGIKQIATKTYMTCAQNRTTATCDNGSCSVLNNTQREGAEPRIFKNLTVRDVQLQLVAIGVMLLVVMQLAVSFQAPYTHRLRKASGINPTAVGKFLHSTTKDIMRESKILFGITPHGVFMDWHFRNYNHVIAVVYEQPDGTEEWLPIIDENGQPGYYNYGFNWVKWTFRVNGPTINQSNLNRGVRDFTAFWAKRHGVSLKNATFRIKVKKIEKPSWRKDFLREQMAKPWVDGGYVVWKNRRFTSKIKNIERL